MWLDADNENNNKVFKVAIAGMAIRMSSIQLPHEIPHLAAFLKASDN